MRGVRIALWAVITIALLRGLLVWDMGESAKITHPIASAICLAGTIIAAAIMCLVERKSGNG